MAEEPQREVAITERKFDKLLSALPARIQELARCAIASPHEVRFQLKKLRPSNKLRKDSWSIRVTNQDYRAIAEKIGNVFHWYWIGSREDFNRF